MHLVAPRSPDPKPRYFLSAHFQIINLHAISPPDMVSYRLFGMYEICGLSGPVNSPSPLDLGPSARYGIILQFVALLHRFVLFLSPEIWIPYKIVMVITWSLIWFSIMAILIPCKKSIIVEATAKLFFAHVWAHFGLPQIFI
jgi:hypothetical protein